MQEKWVEFDPVNSKKKKDFDPIWTRFGPGSGRSTNTHGKNGKLSHVFGKNFVKATFSLKKLLNS